MIISLVAYDLMDPATRQQAVALLHAHPRYVDHFERPLAAGAARRRRRRAGPVAVRLRLDLARRGPLRRRRRHPRGRAAVQPPVVALRQRAAVSERRGAGAPGTHGAIQPPPRPAGGAGRSRHERDPGHQELVAHRRRRGGDAPTLRSVHLCWLLHLVGDSHQPLHSSSLVTRQRFPEGDRGGNLFSARARLSAARVLGQSDLDRRAVPDRCGGWRPRWRRTPSWPRPASRPPRRSIPATWIDEGRELARQYVYTPEVLQKIADREGHTHLGDLRLSPQYEAEAETVAERQAVVAAHRLAALLEQLLP